jgi:hypothetical protein
VAFEQPVLVEVAANARTAAAAVVAQLQPGGDARLNGAEAVEDRFSEEVGGGPPVHPGGGVDPGFAGAMIDDREHRAAAVEARPGGRVGRPQLIGRVGRDATVVLPVRRGRCRHGRHRHLGMRESA